VASRVQIDPGWEAQVDTAVETWFEDHLGPDISDDARRYCPVRTGALKASIEHHVEDGSLIVSATGGGEDENGNLYVSRREGMVSGRGGIHLNPGRNEGSLVTRQVHHVDEGGRTYAAYVELGHRVYHPSTGITGPEVVPPQPFLRPALYQERGE
jgi:hypothetical protein